jgi:hypothetical protein
LLGLAPKDLVEDQAVVDRMQLVDAFLIETGDGRPHGLGAGRDDQLVVAVLPVPRGHGARGSVDLFSLFVEQQLDARLLKPVEAAVCERAPVESSTSRERK